MHHRRWVTAAAASCSLLTFLTAASFLAASEAGLSQSQSSIQTAKLIRVADEAAAPATGTDEGQRPDSSPSIPPKTMLDKNESRGILGTSVRSAADEDMGRVVDVIVDRTGTARAAVIDFGGFLGVGSRKVAVDWNAIRFAGTNGLSIDLTRDQVRTAPQYQEGKPIVVLGAAPEFARSRFTARMPE
jgi:PRC-barrel domain